MEKKSISQAGRSNYYTNPFFDNKRMADDPVAVLRGSSFLQVNLPCRGFDRLNGKPRSPERQTREDEMNRKRCNALGAALAAGLGYAVISPWASPPAWGQDAGALPHGFQTTPVLKSGKTAYGAPLVLPRTDKPEIISLIGVMEPGGRTALHQHPVPTFSYVIEGAITIQAEGQEVKTYQAGEAYLEAIGAWHQAFNKGDKPVKLLLLFVAEEGKPVTITKHQ